ncbi:MAG: response regulator transcription factor [Candidatus Aminicenantes bacterium]|jgi:DNA-binding response OmpR family regulator
MPKKILVIEDEPGILRSLKDEFESGGYLVFTAENGEKGLEMVKSERPDLIILDVMMPKMDGYEVCKHLRKKEDSTPIIMLTVKDKEIDKVLGLELGADDYVTKPFSLRELTARVKALFRRTAERKKERDIYSFGGVLLDFRKYEATKKGKKLDLTALEFHILKLFIERKEQVITRDDFLDNIWGEDNIYISYRTIDSHIANIRKKIEDDPSKPKYIISIRSVGYKFVG